MGRGAAAEGGDSGHQAQCADSAAAAAGGGGGDAGGGGGGDGGGAQEGHRAAGAHRHRWQQVRYREQVRLL